MKKNVCKACKGTGAVGIGKNIKGLTSRPLKYMKECPILKAYNKKIKKESM
jgi:hypothetical protein